MHAICSLSVAIYDLTKLQRRIYTNYGHMPTIPRGLIMSRPPKCRRVAFMPGVKYYKPAGVPLRFLDEVCLSIEELESVRLKDFEDLDQEQCARRMNISRPTFQRVLGSARKKIAGALLTGKAIRIEGGNFEMASLRYSCENGHEWDVSFDETARESINSCPVCQSSAIQQLQPAEAWQGHGRRGRCHRRGFNR